MSSHSIWQDLPRNTAAVGASGRASVGASIKTILTVRYAAVLLYRISQRAGAISPLLGSMLKQVNQAATGAEVAWQAKIESGLILFHPTGVVIGEHASIGRDCSIQQGVTLGSKYPHKPHECPSVGDSVQIGAGARILGSIDLGDHSIVGANAVVTKDVPAHMIAVGVPATLRAREVDAETQ
ncbi:hypothetical protein A4X17_18070 [Plantibacter sp. H53]|uniref:serine O-acetyltransferase n=1 Tax=Plantibacter sp. H53 TaxID=1827323 RepID=UPI0007F3D810|nr:serine acetyltransferase [Plantibacter sp. H53]OAN29673.1 hypothetical protein A4X17_18070 [Plantibacter sp. H53]